MAIVPRIGFTPTGSLPEQEEEIQKLVFSTAIAGSPVLFLDNIKRHTASGAIEGAMTAPVVIGRILGRSQILTSENMMTLFFTGNGATISPDLRRRVLHVELFLREARSEDRRIKHPLDEQAIKELRPAILSHGCDDETHHIAAELKRLHQDGAIGQRSVNDPDASYYANLIRDFGATYTGPVSNVPAPAEPSGDPAKSYIPTAQQRVPRGLSKAELQRDLDDAIANEPGLWKNSRRCRAIGST